MRRTLTNLLLVWILVVLNGCSPLIRQSRATPTSTLTSTPSNPLNQAVIWERSGGIAGVCQKLSINFNGAFVLQNCKFAAKSIEGFLPAEQLDKLNDYLDQFTQFQWEFKPPQGSADMFIDQYQFNGKGNVEPSPADQQMLNQFLASLASSLLALEKTAEENGIEGQVLIGPACAGPVKVDQPCPDKPYQTTIDVLDQSNQSILQFQTDTEGRFRVNLPPGTYTLHPQSSGALPQVADQVVTVTSGQYTQVQITYDSGIR